MKFKKRYRGASLRALLALYVRDLYNEGFRNATYADTQTGAVAELI